MNSRLLGDAKLMAQFAALEAIADNAAEAHLDAFADSLLNEIQQTAPVDTGTYRDDWSKDKKSSNEIWLTNDISYGPYLVFPNSRMTRASGADSQGILHNVRGIVHSHGSQFGEDFSAEFNSQMDSI